jgi:HAD superfamily hydrolase (TIGR01450 family)
VPRALDDAHTLRRWQDRPVPSLVIVCDLDGVIWLSDEVIPGSPGAVAGLRGAGHRVLFVTNNSFVPVADVEAKLAGFGIPAEGDVLTSAAAAASLVRPGERVLLAGGPGAADALAGAGAVLVGTDAEPASVDTVVVGFHRSFDYEGMRRAATAVRAGARLVATNDDATYPTPDGPIPGGGAILAAIATASGVAPLVAGKPYPPMADLVRAVMGGTDHDGLVMVGDRPDTDGRFALTLGARFALVRTGVTAPGDRPDPAPDIEGADLAAVAAGLHQRYG